ncbi:MAG: DUF481 domain-containing protein [Saprospiraceae bacterium]|nr:DUF481 domain-containing protein [Saprospiraceae bacterium]
MTIRSTLTLLLIFIINGTILSQALVNIEGRRRHTDSTRFVMDGNVSSTYSNNDGLTFFQIHNSLFTQLKSKDLNKIYMLLGDYTLARSKDNDFENAWFLHFRYNQEITDLFRIETFVQSQKNKILDVNSRNLIGGGIRMKLISKENVRLYWGNAYMYEVEATDLIEDKFYNHRYSTYVSFTAVIPPNNVKIINTLYYQPLFNDFNDYRFLEQLKITFPITKRFNMFSLFDYFYDSITPQGRKQFSSRISFGFGLRLSSKNG